MLTHFILALVVVCSQLTITLKRLNLAPPNLVIFSFYLLVTFCQNFSKVNLPGGGRGLLQLFLK